VQRQRRETGAQRKLERRSVRLRVGERERRAGRGVELA